MGRVEIYHSGNWSTICDDDWDDTDATVVCREFGYPKGWSKDGGEYPAGTHGVSMDEVQCTGSENRLVDCPFDGWFNHDCDSSEHAGVACDSK